MIIPLSDVFDASDQPRNDYPQNRKKTVNLLFTLHGGKLDLRAWGDAFPDDGGGGLYGRLKYSASEIKAAISALREVWQVNVIEYFENHDDSLLKEFPFADHWDLTESSHPTRWNDVGRRLAREGRQLYSLLFEAGDDGLREIGRNLTQALTSEEQIVVVQSEDLHAPWSMLYTPQPSAPSLEAADASWTMAGFWGYSHLVEQCVDRVRGHDSRIHLRDERLTAGMNVDPRLDEQFKEHPCVAPMIEFFREHTDVEIRRTRPQLASSFENGCRIEQIVYYACHMTVSGRDGTTVSQAQLRLGDDEPVRTSDYQAWLADKQFKPGPVVFANGCQGGQLASQFYSSFGAVLLRSGVNCLIGPQVDLPPLFAYEYAHRFFAEFLRGTRVGDIIQNMTRVLADTCENPLGLVVSLYRGLDTHLSPHGVQTAERT